ncbi:hypothetical protein EI94DRAFT_1719102 [Lactarius quietus]|nr:hypothetical protein EI94DRAFT_1719102 [Lactarius quietus]
MKQTNTRNSKVAVRPQKRTRRSRGRGKDKDADAPALEGTENIPPPGTQEDKSSHQRPARKRGRARTSSRPAEKRGRSENRVEATNTIDSERIAVIPPATDGVSGGKSTSRSGNAGRPRGTGRRPFAGCRTNSNAAGQLPFRARAGADVQGALTISEPVQDVVSGIGGNGETPEVANSDPTKANDEDHWKDTKDQAVPVQIAPSTSGISAAPNEKAESMPMTEADVSTVPPLPSSTRRRAKEYFQRRTRERSGSEIPNPKLRTKEKAGNRKRPASWSVPVSQKIHDQFAFDPEASPFTPNATSSPRQGSLSSIGVQSFSSPSPLPPHGNRKVAPLMLVRASGNSDALEAIDSSSQPIPVTPHGGQQGDTYAYYAGRNHAQAHLQAEQLALMRLQAYYSLLAGNIPTSVGVIRATEHMELSGGGGGLSGGVALGLGRQGGGGQGRGRGRAQSRNASGAYAHPKEHVVYSPREHERAQLAPAIISQHDVEPGVINPQKDEPAEAAAQRTAQKWDGKWGLREGPGKEVGWCWGASGSDTGVADSNSVR